MKQPEGDRYHVEDATPCDGCGSTRYTSVEAWRVGEIVGMSLECCGCRSVGLIHIAGFNGTAEGIAKATRQAVAAFKRADVLTVFEHLGPLTDEQMVLHYETMAAQGHVQEQSVSGLRTRRCELVRMGRLRDSGQRHVTDSGRASVVWEVVPCA